MAVVGRPNVGKSSYINRLIRHERCIVSDIPGTTQDCVEIPFTVGKGEQSRHYLLMDTAGIRSRSRTRSAVERFSMMRTEKGIKQSDVTILILDSEDGPTTRDKKIAAMILEHQKGCLIIANKWDKMEDITQRKYQPMLSQALPFLSFVPVLYSSAQTGYNIRRTIEAIDFVGAQISTEISTGTLNRVLHRAFERVPPPRSTKHPLKLYYVTQVGTRPIRLKLFVNNPKKVSQAYRSYLTKALRSTFGLEGAPIILHFTARSKRQTH